MTLPRLTFTVAGSPLSWARLRRRGSRYFTDPAQRAYRERIAWAFRAARPDGWPDHARYSVRLLAEYGDQRRRDADRVAGIPLDALTGIAWTDDSQVDDLHIVKRVGDDPRLEVEIAVIASGAVPTRAKKGRAA